MITQRRCLAALVAVLLLIGGCGQPSSAVPPATAAPATVTGLSPDQVATLESLEQVDSYPLYTMHYYGSYPEASLPESSLAELNTSLVENATDGFLEPAPPQASTALHQANLEWACSLFAALGDPDNRLYGRNFDWEFSPALVLFMDPPDAYASVSIVDIAFLGFGGVNANAVADLPLDKRQELLSAPSLPFDGMNEQGLAIGMAAVPAGDMQPDPSKETIGELGVIREMLDHARSVDEAVAILKRYNVNMEEGTPIHYLIADRSGRAALVEFYQGEMAIFPNEAAWHQATNFLRAAAGPSPAGQCWRYDEISRQLTAMEGRMRVPQAMDLLAKVAQPHTQWSVVYHMSSGKIRVVLGRQYSDVHTFSLELEKR